MSVVCNTSPIINLAAIHKLSLLRQLYGRIAIPPAVYHEVVVVGAGEPGASAVQSADWIEALPIQQHALVEAPSMELDPGEAEAIALAVECHAELLLLDERRGRIVARRLGCQVLGLLGCLLDAKNQKIIPAINPLIDDLIHQAGFWIGHPLYQCVLNSAGEMETE